MKAFFSASYLPPIAGWWTERCTRVPAPAASKTSAATHVEVDDRAGSPPVPAVDRTDAPAARQPRSTWAEVPEGRRVVALQGVPDARVDNQAGGAQRRLPDGMNLRPAHPLRRPLGVGAPARLTNQGPGDDELLDRLQVRACQAPGVTLMMTVPLPTTL